MTDYSHMNQGNAKLRPNEKVFKINPDKDKGKRKVKVNSNTWIYTNKPTDEQAIREFNEKYANRDNR